jgi:hypothetical protein
VKLDAGSIGCSGVRHVKGTRHSNTATNRLRPKPLLVFGSGPINQTGYHGRFEPFADLALRLT